MPKRVHKWHFHSPFVIKCQKGNEKKHEVHLLIIFILDGILGGILIFIGVGVLTIVYGWGKPMPSYSQRKTKWYKLSLLSSQSQTIWAKSIGFTWNFLSESEILSFLRIASKYKYSSMLVDLILSNLSWNLIGELVSSQHKQIQDNPPRIGIFADEKVITPALTSGINFQWR